MPNTLKGYALLFVLTFAATTTQAADGLASTATPVVYVSMFYGISLLLALCLVLDRQTRRLLVQIRSQRIDANDQRWLHEHGSGFNVGHSDRIGSPRSLPH